MKTNNSKFKDISNKFQELSFYQELSEIETNKVINGGSNNKKKDIKPIKIVDSKWFYDRGTPQWVIESALAAGYEVQHVEDSLPLER